jgi:dihydrolipoamide dehydrogenase
MSQVYDLIVIGSGPGGYIAAARAGALGLKTAIVERDPALGGTCLHRGCIPTKALLHAADTYSELKEAPKIGISVEGVKVEWEKIQKYKSKIVQTNASGVAHLMKSRQVEVFKGTGRVSGPHHVIVEPTEKGGKVIELSAERILVAVGSTPRALPFAPFDHERILSSDSMLEIDRIPGSLTIIGGGVIGIEFASLFARMGTEVTVVEALPRIIANADPDCSKELATQLEQQGVRFLMGAKVSDMKATKKGTVTTITNAAGETQVLEAGYALVAVGRKPLTENIGLESTKARTEKGFIVVNGHMQSDEPTLYAIGDCVNTPWLAHVASFEGCIAVEHMAGLNPAPFNYDHTPSCVYSDPPVAWCGITEDEAKKRGIETKTTRFDFIRNGKASILGKKRGFVKFVHDVKYGEILGAHIVGPDATELIAEPSFAMQLEATIDDIAHTMHAHPTLYESIYEAANAATGRAMHG